MKYSTEPLPGKEYIQVAPNYYVLRDKWMKMHFSEKHLSLCYCIAGRRKKFILTGLSACVVYGIATLDRTELRPQAICTTRRRSEYIRWHYRKTAPGTRTVEGLLVTSPVIAIIDMALHVTPESLLVSINDGLFKKLFSKEDLATAIQLHSGKRGKLRLERLAEFATAKCESPLETYAWIEIYKAGFVLPQQQVKINIGQGKSFRVDMYWEFNGRKIILELDGRVKYTDNQVLFEEKQREDKLHVMGYEFIRCVWDNVSNGDLIQMLANTGIPRRRYFGKTFPT